ncbi:exportin-2 [Anaeramoeba ignava]|uniref:Exportin-2 n=1 Tax=Anaeramoeba ignava TaxID=1746090 RepID=A0A9Q0LE52_ANAIG|nr:exportin-2 [Anaeramoeba ignava]
MNFDEETINNLTTLFQNTLSTNKEIRKQDRWDEDNEEIGLTSEEKEKVKENIVTLILTTPKLIQRQLSDSLSVIAFFDFPDRWKNLVPELLQKLATKDFSTINGILSILIPIIKHFRYEEPSDELFLEIKYVLENLQQPLLDLAQEISNHFDTTDNNDIGYVNMMLSSLIKISKIFYSLCVQVLPEFFEDNMKPWMEIFHKFLNYENSSIISQTDDPTNIEKLQTNIIQNINLYVTKYTTEFDEFIKNFLTDTWTLLLKTTQDMRYDRLVSTGITFLTSVAKGLQKNLFEDNEVLKNICEKIVIPNMYFRDTEEELFEFHPVEYIRRDIEGSNEDTRRRSACELVKALRSNPNIETLVTEIFSEYVQIMFNEYAENAEQNWKSKDAAISLVISLATIASTQSSGVTKINELININDFYRSHILSELNTEDINQFPVLQADSLKFVLSFRNQLPKEELIGIFNYLIRLLTSQIYVLNTYSSIVIEKLLISRDLQTRLSRFTHDDIKPFIESLLENLFSILTFPDEKVNDYVMKAILRVIVVAKSYILPYAEVALKQLCSILLDICKNPTNPMFNHYLFESIAALIRNCKSENQDLQSFDEVLFPAFDEVLQQEGTDLSPYVFQIISQMLELSGQNISNSFFSVFLTILSSPLWESRGNVPALSRFIQSFLSKASQVILEKQQLEAVLGIFQKLIASRANEVEAFNILNSIIKNIDLSHILPFLERIIRIILLRLEKNKTEKFKRLLAIFTFLFISRNDVLTFVKQVEMLQEGLFQRLLDAYILPVVSKIYNHKEQRISIIGLTKLLTESKLILEKNFSPFWTRILLSILELINNYEKTTEKQADKMSKLNDDKQVEELDFNTKVEFSTRFSLLIFSTTKIHDNFVLPNPKEFFINQLKIFVNQNSSVNFHNFIQQSEPDLYQQIIEFLDSLGFAFDK